MVTMAQTIERNKTVLVVDDEPDIRMILQARLEAAGYRVETAGNGLEALNRIRSQPPDLVILDLMLPGIDGFAVCAMLKRDQRFSHIPIVILSARSQAQDKKTGVSLGADAYLTKLFQPQELLTTIENLIEPKTPAHSEPGAEKQ